MRNDKDYERWKIKVSMIGAITAVPLIKIHTKIDRTKNDNSNQYRTAAHLAMIRTITVVIMIE